MGRTVVMVIFMLLIAECGADVEQRTSDTTAPVSTPAATVSSTAPAVHADVEGVTVRGNGGSYTFSVTVSSPDTGCGQYADWWEVLTESGELMYRRVLLHSHVNEQPFTRTGGPVDAQPDETVIVRAHMNTTGYGGVVMRGSVVNGFSSAKMPSGFGVEVETVEPLPTDCAF